MKIGLSSAAYYGQLETDAPYAVDNKDNYR